MEDTKLKIIDFYFDIEKGVFSFTLNLWVLLIVIILIFIVTYLIKRYRNNSVIEKNLKPVKLKYSLGGTEVEYEITRNYKNIEIAHRIYIELITRKAALEIEEDKDVIVEVYNSWYSLFNITRDELKSIDGVLIKDNNKSNELVGLLTDILNKGLRPHLTEYQAKFRKWYNEQIEIDNSSSPQEIQANYEDFTPLMNSMKQVNTNLMDYSKQLKKIIDGE
ncbi:hypothetical protein [Marinifilum flexuosum]|uniref:Uncharacterized protein n=1 Tax=Marinifilum flexuosum TaxID=1117708 RepID=A0A419X8I7_9BACT|nr:hypothetical protein [Marinifilum flexuosum]RKE04064.1 hypothetical protein BXY64_1078 [Marinifilum flexuosum]